METASKVILTGVPKNKMSEWFAERSASSATLAADLKSKTREWAGLASWSVSNLVPVAFVLAKDQMVAVHGDSKKGFKATGFHRADGTLAWSVDLPERPAMNRMAIDRNGRVLVTLCDGSVICIGR